MEVDCWAGDWGLPSVHPECLKILAFAKFSGAPVVQRSSNNPFWTPRGDLPVFRHNGRQLTDFQTVRQGQPVLTNKTVPVNKREYVFLLCLSTVLWCGGSDTKFGTGIGGLLKGP
jgi:metaxin